MFVIGGVLIVIISGYLVIKMFIMIDLLVCLPSNFRYDAAFLPVLMICVYLLCMMIVSAKKDFYDLLGVPRGATEKEIKKAYFQLAKKYHPDTNPGDDQAAKKFAEISEAYEVVELLYPFIYHDI